MPPAERSSRSSTTTYVPMSSEAMSRLACERCRFHKLRCVRHSSENGTEACIRCRRAGATCTTKARGPVGRPRGVNRSDRSATESNHAEGNSTEQTELPRAAAIDLTQDPEVLLLQHLMTSTKAPHDECAGEEERRDSISSQISTTEASPVTQTSLSSISPAGVIEANMHLLSPINSSDILPMSEAEKNISFSVRDMPEPTIGLPTEGSNERAADLADAHAHDSGIVGGGVESRQLQNMLGDSLEHQSSLFDQYGNNDTEFGGFDISSSLLPIDQDSPQLPEDYLSLLLELNQRLQKQSIRIEQQEGNIIFVNPIPENNGFRGYAEIEEILKISQEFSSLLSRILRSAEAAYVMQVSRQYEFLETGSRASGCLDSLNPPIGNASVRPSRGRGSSTAMLDTVVILQISGCYIYLIRIHTLLFSQLLHVLTSGTFSDFLPLQVTFPGFQIGGFSLKNNNLQVLILVQVVVHILNEIEGTLGIPAEYSVCGLQDGKNEGILADLVDTMGLADLCVSSLKQEERLRRASSCGGVKRLKELIEKVKDKLS